MKTWTFASIGLALGLSVCGCETGVEDVRQAEQNVREERSEGRQEIAQAEADARQEMYEVRKEPLEEIREADQEAREEVAEERREAQEEISAAERELAETKRQAAKDYAEDLKTARQTLAEEQQELADAEAKLNAAKTGGDQDAINDAQEAATAEREDVNEAQAEVVRLEKLQTEAAAVPAK